MRKPYFKYLDFLIPERKRTVKRSWSKRLLQSSLKKSCLIALGCIPGLLSAQDYDHSSYLATRIAVGLPGKEVSINNDINSPNLNTGFSIGLEGAWLWHRNFGFYGTLIYGAYEGKSNNGTSNSNFTDLPARGKLNNSRSIGGILLSFPFKVNTLELKGGIGYGQVHGLIKKPFDPFGDPQQRILNYTSSGIWNQLGIQFRTEKYEKVNIAFFADYTFMNGSSRVTDIYKAGELKYESKLQYSFYEIGVLVLLNFDHTKRSIFHH